MTKGNDTRTTIVRRALREASRSGLEGISIGALAKTLEMSKSGLFAHFGSKDGLQKAVLELGADLFVTKVVQPATKEPRGLPRVQALFDNWLRWTDSEVVPGGCLFMSSTFELDDRPGPARDVLAVLMRAFRTTLARAAAIAAEEGHFRADLDLDQFAFQMHALLLAHQVEARLFRSPDATALARRSFQSLLMTASPQSH
ncbi:MAG: AcrR family transcriptional regulator [Myxococcota bacterium]|jgi:AcrR family transcriptional regulator